MVITIANRAEKRANKSNLIDEKNTLEIRVPHCDDQKVHTLKVSNRLRIGVIIEKIAGIFHLCITVNFSSLEFEQFSYQMNKSSC